LSLVLQRGLRCAAYRSEELRSAATHATAAHIVLGEKARLGGAAKAWHPANYIKALEKRAGEILAKEERPKAKGLLIAVGIKSKKNTRIWCQAVEGDALEALLQKLEKELAKIEAVDLKKGPAGFAMEVNLFGKKPDKYPEFPQSWVEAAKKSETKLLLLPDDLFKTIWPDK
jgi:hypothetical protein